MQGSWRYDSRWSSVLEPNAERSTADCQFQKRFSVRRSSSIPGDFGPELQWHLTSLLDLQLLNHLSERFWKQSSSKHIAGCGVFCSPHPVEWRDRSEGS